MKCGLVAIEVRTYFNGKEDLQMGRLPFREAYCLHSEGSRKRFWASQTHFLSEMFCF